MSLDNFIVHELNNKKIKNVNGGRNLQIRECNGGSFTEPYQRVGEVV
jgi:hypothetical protein